MMNTGTESEKMAFEGIEVSVVWNHGHQAGDVLVLGHGAGGTLHTPGLVEFAAAMAARSTTVVRFNFPYAEARRRVPDRPPVLEGCFRAVASHVADRVGRGGTRRGSEAGLLLGGRSMGGRIASHIVAGGFPARGLVFLGYPLHPPRQPERLRDAHLGRIGVPMLFLQGSRDAFARPDLLTRTISRLPSATLRVVDRADHGLTVRGKPAAEMANDLADVATAWVAALPDTPRS